MQENDGGKPSATTSPPWGWGKTAQVIRLAARLNRMLEQARILREMEELGVPALDNRQKPKP
jgi:hypothetical protein